MAEIVLTSYILPVYFIKLFIICCILADILG